MTTLTNGQDGIWPPTGCRAKVKWLSVTATFQQNSAFSLTTPLGRAWVLEEGKYFRHNSRGKQRTMDTSASLLDSLRSPTNEKAWEQLFSLYHPLIRGWLRRLGAPTSEHDDLAQEVLTVVVRRVGEFRKEPRVGAFRSWLRTITTNCLRDHWKRRGRRPVAAGGSDFAVILAQLEDPQSGVSKLWDREHDKYVIEHLLKLIQTDFSEKTWKAFQELAIKGRPAAEVAEALNMTTNAVFIAKSRVMARLQIIGQGLVDL